MRIGIYSRYCASDATYAAGRIADWALSRGHSVSILSATDRSMSLSAAWDPLVVSKFATSFTSWASQQDAVIWTHSPPKEQLNWVKSKQIVTAVVVLWHELYPAHVDTYRLFDRVLCPSNVCGQLLIKSWKLRNVVALPWDSGFPLTTKPSASGDAAMKLLVPILDRSPANMEMTAVAAVERLLQQLQVLRVTLAYIPSRLASRVRRRIEELAATYKPRLRLVRNPALAVRPLLFHSHDLTLWMSQAEDIGLVGLQSLSMGTPVVGFKISPITEFLQDGYNGRVMPCDCGLGYIGAPIADPDYNVVEQSILSLWSHPKLLATMEQRTSQGLQARRKHFDDTLLRLFP